MDRVLPQERHQEMGSGMAGRVAFLFDMDGTIADTMPFHLQAWMELLPELGVRMAPEEFSGKPAAR